MKDIFTPADILLPRAGTDMTKWAALACDQFSARPDYWDGMSGYVGGAPSALRLMLPEAYLTAPDAAARKAAAIRTMEDYLVGDVFRKIPDSYIFVERKLPDGTVRRGLVGKLDLEAYDWASGSQPAVRSTEATVRSRLPARVELRRQAALEMPHIVLFMDDEADSVLGAVQPGETLYDFDLYAGGGHIKGYRVAGPAAEAVQAAVEALPGPIVFAMGDGNHSLAAAKSLWEELKAAGAPAGHPARYALAELENLRDGAVRCTAGTWITSMVRRRPGPWRLSRDAGRGCCRPWTRPSSFPISCGRAITPKRAFPWGRRWISAGTWSAEKYGRS